MAKALGVSVTFVLFTVLCLYFLVRMVLNQNTTLAVITGYPTQEEIGATINAASNHSGSLFTPPLRTQGRYILDSNNSRFKLISINWYGASDMLYIPGGLDMQHRNDIAATIRKLGFNSVRLPYADEMVRKNPIIPAELLTANADLTGSHALDVFDAVVQSLTQAGLAVIINNHITQARWCCDASPCDGLWSNDFYYPFCSVQQTEDQWIENWETIMRPHVQNPLVIGVDLRNEVRGLLGRYMWDDWALAAERAAEQLLLMQPNWLIIVEGVSSANDISGARKRPVELSLPGRLVYSAHVYGWSGWGTLRPYWKRNYKSFAADMQQNWMYLLESDIAPVWIGEFGAPDNPNEGDLHYWGNLVRILELSDADFGYWAINPRKPKDNEAESYSIVEDDWKTPKLDYRTYDIARLVLAALQRDGETTELKTQI